MVKRVLDVAIYATPERVRKAREMVIEPRETGSAGNVILTGQKELQECALDTLLRNGYLRRKTDRKDEARWRFNAGFWLRELYLKTHPTDGVGAYSVRLEGQRAFAERTTDMVSEEEHWNFQCFQDTVKALKGHWRILEQVCCEDCALGTAGPVLDALDALYDLREGYISDYLASFERALENE